MRAITFGAPMVFALPGAGVADTQADSGEAHKLLGELQPHIMTFVNRKARLADAPAAPTYAHKQPLVSVSCPSPASQKEHGV